MASVQETEFLGEASSYSEDKAPNPSASTRSKTLEDGSSSNENSLTKSSPAVLVSSKNDFRSVPRRYYPGSLIRHIPKTSTESLNIFANSRRNVHMEMNGQDEERTNCCTTAINWYKNSAIKLRNSAYISIVYFLFSLIPASAVAMGIIFATNCPKVHFLFVFGAVLGTMGGILLTIWTFVSNRHGTPYSHRQKLVLGVMCFLVLNLTIVDAVFVFRLPPVFGHTLNEYCIGTFYKYAFYKEIATFVAIVLSAMLYLPRSSHMLCCHNCTMRSPPNPYNSI